MVTRQRNTNPHNTTKDLLTYTNLIKGIIPLSKLDVANCRRGKRTQDNEDKNIDGELFACNMEKKSTANLTEQFSPPRKICFHP